MFEGKRIKYISPSGKEYNAMVVSCVKDIGVTIVNADDSSQYLRCLVMKNAPNFWPGKGEITKTRKMFTILRKGIINGIVDRSLEYIGGFASSDTCPFGQ